MLIDFTFGNYRSFRDEATLSLIAAAKLRADERLDEANVFPAWQKLSLLRVAAIYGANASGKSNVIRALSDFRNAVALSADRGFSFQVEPFLLSTEAPHQPILFELRFIMEGTPHRYGFELRNPQGGSGTEIVAEWLYQSNSSRESRLFLREGDKVELADAFREAAPLLREGHIKRTEALVLSLAAQIGGKWSSRIVTFLLENLHIVSGLDDTLLRNYTEQRLEKGLDTRFINALMREADTGIDQVHLQSDDEIELRETPTAAILRSEDLAEERKRFKQEQRLVALHPVYGADGKPQHLIGFPMSSNESEGTQKLFAFAGPIAHVLRVGAILVVDEMDARFHPLLTQKLIGLFQSEKTNPKNAQLIFVTHDTNLLDAKRFRRDQIWFIEKDRQGASRLYSLAEFKDVRKSSNYEQDYLEGRYGALPFIGDLSSLLGKRATDALVA